MNYETFLIADFSEGIRQDKDPWLQPNNAFIDLDNIFMRRGILQKRHGYSYFARIGVSTVEDLGLLGGTVYGITFADDPVVAGTIFVSDDVEYFVDNGAGVLTGTAGGTGTYTTTTISVTFNSVTTVAPTVAYQVYSDSDTDVTIRGIYNLENVLSENRGIVVDRQKLLEYNVSLGIFQAKPDDTGSYSYFNSSSELMYGVGYLDRHYVCDGVDNASSGGMWYYDPSAGHTGEVTKFEPQIGNLASQVVKKAKILKPYYRRMVAFYTVEEPSGSSVVYKQRARWSRLDAVDATEDWRADIPGVGSSLDAATNEVIVSVGMVKGTMVVAFERSIWLFEYTGNAQVPFRWRRLAGNLEIGSILGTVETEDMVIFIGHGGIYGCDGVRVEDISSKIPDFTLDEIKLNATSKISATFDSKLNQVLMAYPNVNEGIGENTDIKVFSVTEGWFSNYSYGMRCLGNYVNIDEKIWDDYLIFDGETATLQDYAGMTGYDLAQQSLEHVVLGGNTKGYLYKINDTSAQIDEPENVSKRINYSIESKDYAPFVEKGKSVVLGYIDIFNSSVDGGAYTIFMKSNSSPGHYMAKDVKIDGVNKIWKRVNVRQSGNSHSFSIKMTEEQLSGTAGLVPIRFHAFRLGMREGGEARMF